jgi:hypothetical protein
VKNQITDVKSKSKKVGVAEYPVYESTAEAVGTIGEEKVLELLNAQVRTNAMNVIRGMFNKMPSMKYFEDAALDALTDEELLSVRGNREGRKALIAKKAEELKKAWQAERDAAAAKVGDDEEEEEDE